MEVPFAAEGVQGFNKRLSPSGKAQGQEPG